MTALTPDHIAILQALKDHKGKPLNMSALMEKSDVCKRSFWPCQIALREAGYILGERVPGKRGTTMIATIEMEGRRALAAYHRRQEQAERDLIKTPPRSISLFDLPTYKPSNHQAYYRNNGNTHIPSRGFAC